jgi:hypothetical protein
MHERSGAFSGTHEIDAARSRAADQHCRIHACTAALIEFMSAIGDRCYEAI